MIFIIFFFAHFQVRQLTQEDDSSIPSVRQPKRGFVNTVFRWCSRYDTAVAPDSRIAIFTEFARYLCFWLATSRSRRKRAGSFWLPMTAVGCARRPYTPHKERDSFS